MRAGRRPAASEAAAGAVDPRLPLISVVTATRNRPDSLERLLDSLSREGYPRLEILLYDDASDPPLRCERPEVTLLRGEEPRGACFGRNRLFELARGEFVAMLDDDTEFVEPGVFARSVELMRREPDIGMLMYREMRSDGVYNNPVGPAGEALEIARPGFYGCFIRTEALRRAGPYLVDVFGYYVEEVEFGIRLLDAGYRTVYVPWLAVHHHGDRRGRDWRRIFRMTASNYMTTALLRYPLRDIPRGLAGPVRMFLKRPPVDGRRDWFGLAWVAKDILAKMPYVARNRAPVRHATVQRHRALARHPEPVQFDGERAVRGE